jgi:hypothetical protein
MIAVVASIQVGYIAGCILRAIVAATRANNDGVALPTPAQPVGVEVGSINEEGIELSPNLGDRRRQAAAV